jgi:hypothetical protein
MAAASSGVVEVREGAAVDVWKIAAGAFAAVWCDFFESFSHAS